MLAGTVSEGLPLLVRCLMSDRRQERLARLEALQAAGVSMSRNRHFDVFADPDNRSALALHRYLDALAQELCDPTDLTSIAVQRADDEVTLTVERGAPVSTHVAVLHPREFDALSERDGVAEALDAHGVAWRAGAAG